MCRIEERVYVSADGHRKAFEDSFPCDQARRGKLCHNVKRKTVEYHSKPPHISRDDASSPASYNPPTPTGSGSYVVENRAPAPSGRRSSTAENTRVIKPEIIIEFGSRKDKGKKYRTTSTKYKRSSLGASSIGSNDVAVDSPGSEASYTFRTGFPEASIQHPDPTRYATQPVVPPRGHRHTSSASSHTMSSQPPSLYTSEPESPSGMRAPRYPPTIVHNPPTGALSPPSPSITRPAPGPSSPYRTTIATPKHSADNVGPDGIFPLDYSEFQSYPSSSQPSSSRAAAPEIFERDEERARQRKARADADKKRQEKADLEMAKALEKEEQVRQAQMELGRAEARAKERAENAWAQIEQRRAEEREGQRRLNQQKQQEDSERAAREAKERAAREARKQADRLSEEVARKERELREAEAQAKLREKTRESRPPTRDPNRRSRRRSMSQHEIFERDRLLAFDTKAQMAIERDAAKRREQEEQAAQAAQAAIFRQHPGQTSLPTIPQAPPRLVGEPQDPHYWDPRGGNRLPTAAHDNSGLGRRNSVSARRGSVSGLPPPPMGSSQRRVSIIQPSPPVIKPQLNQGFVPAVVSPGAAHAQPSHTRPPSARHPSYDRENPFAAQLPQPRVSNTSQDNPFATAAVPLDPWDARDMRDALPSHETRPSHTRQTSSSEDRFHHSLRRRGEEVIERAAASGSKERERKQKHDRARQATRNISKVVGFEDDYVYDSDGSEDEGNGKRREGRGKSGKRRA